MKGPPPCPAISEFPRVACAVGMLAEPGAVNDVIVIVKGRRLVRHRTNIVAMTPCSVKTLASFDEIQPVMHRSSMPRGQKMTAADEAVIVKQFWRKSHASFVASKTGFSFSTVWRVAEAASIELTEGKRAKGYKRLSPKRLAAVIEARRAKPDALQREIAAQAGSAAQRCGGSRVAVHGGVA